MAADETARPSAVRTGPAVIQVSLADDLAQTEDGDAKECDGGAHGEGLVVEGAPADRGGAESELPAELVEGGLLVTGVLAVSDDREIGGEAEEHVRENAQRRSGQGETGAGGGGCLYVVRQSRAAGFEGFHPGHAARAMVGVR
ncbi:hypothetical protein ABT126_33910, partial [Streptomyces sp. NPDC002012]|uniref:hypothetical protein n=1 Tax=Streptomyces sp. NPDC002012 TaxID=3154532 RepID=UPI0033248573